MCFKPCTDFSWFQLISPPARHQRQLPAYAWTEPSLLPGLSDQCNRSQKHWAGCEISSKADLGEDILSDYCLTISFQKLIAQFRQSRHFSKAAACRRQSDTGFAPGASWVNQAGPEVAPAKGSISSCTERMVAHHGKGCPALWQQWNQWPAPAQKCSSHTLSSSQHLMAAGQMPQIVQERREKAFYQWDQSLQVKTVCEILPDTGQCTVSSLS